MMSSRLFSWLDGKGPAILRDIILNNSDPKNIQGCLSTLNTREGHVISFEGLGYTTDAIVFWVVSRSGNRKVRIEVSDQGIYGVGLLIDTVQGISW